MPSHSDSAQVVISKDLRDRLKVLAAQEHTTIGEIVTEALEARAYEPPIHPALRRQSWARDWKRRVREYIGNMDPEKGFGVVELVHHVVLAPSPSHFPFFSDGMLNEIKHTIRAYVETLPGIFPGPDEPDEPDDPHSGRWYYLSKDRADLAHEDARLIDAELAQEKGKAD